MVHAAISVIKYCKNMSGAQGYLTQTGLLLRQYVLYIKGAPHIQSQIALIVVRRNSLGLYLMVIALTL